MGALSFAIVPGLQLYVVQLSKKYLPGTQDVASAFNVASFNIGIATGAYVGGLVVASHLGLGGTPWVGAIFVMMAAIVTYLSANITKK
jgi:predicted MFS family arabinose efflux permease